MCDQYRLSLAHQTSLLFSQYIQTGAHGARVTSSSDASNRRVVSADFSRVCHGHRNTSRIRINSGSLISSYRLATSNIAKIAK